jgi:hypothetical protein
VTDSGNVYLTATAEVGADTGIYVLTPEIDAEFLQVDATATGYAADNPRDGAFDTLTANTLLAFSRSTVLDRGIIEFDVSAIPTGQWVQGTSLRLRSVSSTLNQPRLDIYGYAGNGVVELADADRVERLVGAAVPVDPATNELTLEGPLLDCFLGDLAYDGNSASDWAGFVVTIAGEPTSGVSSRQFADASGANPPELSIPYQTQGFFTQVPGPGLLGLGALAAGLAVAGGRLARRRGDQAAPD